VSALPSLPRMWSSKHSLSNKDSPIWLDRLDRLDRANNDGHFSRPTRIRRLDWSDPQARTVLEAGYPRFYPLPGLHSFA
jgi:hypothetical protein